MNLVVVVDKSGSMGEPDKLEWVKESLLVLLDTLRDKDYLSSGTSTRCVSPSR
jgi:Mg-chelatase subunit ChlD